MVKETFCQWCNKEIRKGEKAAGMYTYNKFPEVSDERYFHFNCFLEWRDSKVAEAGMKAYQKSMKGIMPLIKPMAQNIANSIINNNEETNASKIYKIGSG